MFLSTIFIILAIIAGAIVGLLINGLIWWGIGNLVIYVFNIDYVWTFLHGLCISLITVSLIPHNLRIKLNNKEGE